LERLAKSAKQLTNFRSLTLPLIKPMKQTKRLFMDNISRFVLKPINLKNLC